MMPLLQFEGHEIRQKMSAAMSYFLEDDPAQILRLEDPRLSPPGYP